MNLKVENNILFVQTNLDKFNVSELKEQFLRLNKSRELQGVSVIDLEAVQEIDSAGVALLDSFQELLESEAKLLLMRGASASVRSLIETFSTTKLEFVEVPKPTGLWETVGESALNFYQMMVTALTLASEIFYYSLVGIFSRKTARKGSLIQQAFILGSQALPIVALLSFIIGFILSLQSGMQLKNFGVGVFLADLLSITMVREMGPLITSIIVAGRSGSAIASEIATMEVTEELDALRMMALHPIKFIVVPKFHAITIVMPILVMFSILVSQIGGAIIAVGVLDNSFENFVARSINILSIKDIIISFSKSIWFAWVIVIVGAFYGFQVKGGAEGVGKATTSAVVTSIFAVIVFDAIFSLLYL